MKEVKKQIVLEDIKKAIEMNKMLDDVRMYPLLKKVYREIAGLDSVATDNVRLALEFYEDSDVETFCLPQYINSKLVTAYRRLSAL